MSPLFVTLTVLFCVCLIVSNLMEIKTIQLGPLELTAGFIVFPISYIINDCMVEIYGFRKARLVIWLGFAANLLVVLLLQAGLLLPGTSEWTAQPAMETIYGTVPRMLGASFTAFLCGSMVNAYVMSKMKIGQGGRHFSLRAVASTVFGETVDSLVFFPIAFWGILPTSTIVALVLTQAGLKTLYEIIALPVTIRVVRVLKRREELDVYDYNVSYRWWRIFDF